MPWDITSDYIRSGHNTPSKFDSGSFRTIDIDVNRGIKAIVGCPKGKYSGGKCSVGVQVQSYLFLLKKGWDVAKAKAWFRDHTRRAKVKN